MNDAELRQIKPSWGRRMAGIEGLRGVAAGSVLLGHTVILLGASGFVGSAMLGKLTGLMLQGLTLFFVLSGFLLYRPFASAIINGRTAPRARDFLRNRVLRIWPAYLVILALVGFVFGAAVLDPGLGIDAEGGVGYLTDPLLLISNVFLLQGWFPGTLLTGLSVSWSLIPEVSFYLLLPVLAALGMRLVGRMSLVSAALLPALLLLVVGLVGRAVSVVAVGGADPAAGAAENADPTWADVLQRSIVGQGDLFALGMIAAVVVVAAQRIEPRQVRRLRVVAWIAMMGGVLAVPFAGPTENGVLFTVMAVVCASAILVLLLPGPGGVARLGVRLLESLPMRATGLCSYSIYLWHFPVILFLREHVEAARYDSLSSLPISIVWVVVPTLLLSAVTYRYVEAPAMRRKTRTDRPAQATATTPEAIL